jgi:hypothetical protein
VKIAGVYMGVPIQVDIGRGGISPDPVGYERLVAKQILIQLFKSNHFDWMQAESGAEPYLVLTADEAAEFGRVVQGKGI